MLSLSGPCTNHSRSVAIERADNLIARYHIPALWQLWIGVEKTENTPKKILNKKALKVVARFRIPRDKA